MIESDSCARFHCIKDSIYSDGHVGFCEYRNKLLTLRTVGAKVLHVAPQSGSVAHYAAGIIGKKPRLQSFVYHVYKLLISQTIGILQGRMGIHSWDVPVVQVHSTSGYIVRKQLLAVGHF